MRLWSIDTIMVLITEDQTAQQKTERMDSVTARLFSSVRTTTKLFLRQNPNLKPEIYRLLVLGFSSTSSDLANPRGRTPLQKQFETWTDRLRPGFTASDVDAALRSQSDPDLALDIFRWTSHHNNRKSTYRHTSEVYHTMLEISISHRRYSQTEILIDEILSGACADTPSLALLNSIVHFCCSRRHLFSRAFDVFKHMRKLGGPRKPSMETYSMLLSALLRRFDQSGVCFVYMHSVRSLVRQMRASGVIPDTFLINLIIKAHTRCLEIEEAVRVYREMGLYGCDPNEYTYGYLVKGMCQKGRIEEGMGYFREMRGKGLVPTASVYMTVTNSLALQRKFEEAVEVVLDMVGNFMSPDLLTSRTLLEGLCREGKEAYAFRLLEEMKKRKVVDDKTHARLLDGLNWVCENPPEP